MFPSGVTCLPEEVRVRIMFPSGVTCLPEEVRVRIMFPSGVTCLPVHHCFRELHEAL